MDLIVQTFWIAWGWFLWGLGHLYFTFPFYLFIWPATFAAFVSARSEYLTQGGGAYGTWKAVVYLFTNLPRIIVETMRWMARVLIVDLPRVFGKDVSSSLPGWFLRWIGAQAPAGERVVEKIVYRDKPVQRRSFKSALFLRLRWMLLGALALYLFQHWETVEPIVTSLLEKVWP